MERKTKHRLLGILVMVGLVILLLPLFQTSKDDTADSAMLNTPPFPNQHVDNETATTTPAAEPSPDPGTQSLPIRTGQESQSAFNQQPDDTINLSQTSPATVKQAQTSISQQPQPPALAPAPATNNIQTVKQPGDFSADNSTSTTPVPPAQDTVAKQDDDDENTDVQDNVFRNSYKQPDSNKSTVAPTISAKKANTAAKKTVTKSMSAALRKQNLDKDGLFKIKTSAWVIQLGSYKNKNHALRLVNKLRSHGYHAFIQQIADNTSVYVGPENKQEHARALATQLANDMHLQGFVISYKPLTL